MLIRCFGLALCLTILAGKAQSFELCPSGIKSGFLIEKGEYSFPCTEDPVFNTLLVDEARKTLTGFTIQKKKRRSRYPATLRLEGEILYSSIRMISVRMRRTVLIGSVPQRVTFQSFNWDRTKQRMVSFDEVITAGFKDFIPSVKSHMLSNASRYEKPELAKFARQIRLDPATLEVWNLSGSENGDIEALQITLDAGKLGKGAKHEESVWMAVIYIEERISEEYRPFFYTPLNRCEPPLLIGTSCWRRHQTKQP